MIYSPKAYAASLRAALSEAGQDKQGEIIRRFLALIERQGAWHLMPKIVDAFEAEIIREKGGSRVRIEMARPLEASLLTSLVAAFKPEDRIVTEIRPELIAGVRITVDGSREFDVSMRNKLKKLFVPRERIS